MTTEAILLSIGACLLYGVILATAQHRLFWWYVLAVALFTGARWGVIAWAGYESAAYYYTYHAVALTHPVFQIALLVGLYQRRVPDGMRWAGSSVKVAFFGALVWQSGVSVQSVHSALVFAECLLVILVLGQVMLTGARLRVDEGGLLLGLAVSAWLGLCLYGGATFGGVEQWREWVQRSALLPWGIWATSSIRARSGVRKAGAAVLRGRSSWLRARFEAARTTIQRAGQRRRPRQLSLAFRAPFGGQYVRRG